jgi:hypothetical protein
MNIMKNNYFNIHFTLLVILLYKINTQTSELIVCRLLRLTKNQGELKVHLLV